MNWNRVLTIGTFDLLHPGHLMLFKRCETLGDRIHVGVNSDEFVREYKGVTPVFTFEERKQFISQLGYAVHENDGPGRELIERIRPHYLVIGSDWATRPYLDQIGVTAEWLFDEMGVVLVYVPYTKGVSTGEIKERLR